MRSFLSACAGAAALLAATSAFAFCRTTTCDPKTESCTKEANGCVTGGHPLFWREKCISFSVQKDGSAKRHISYATADHLIQLAFQAWTYADCGGGQTPSFRMWDTGPVECNEPEFNDLLPNANVWMFRDDDWPYAGQANTLALTTVLFEKSTGIILDADVEVNSFRVTELTTSDTNVGRDFQAIATHEAGHFLGLSHSNLETATMNAAYHDGDLDYRSLHPDDKAGICEVYPPDRAAVDCTEPHPAHGFSRVCGGGNNEPPGTSCAVRLPVEHDPARGLARLTLFVAGAAGLVAYRRRARRP